MDLKEEIGAMKKDLRKSKAKTTAKQKFKLHKKTLMKRLRNEFSDLSMATGTNLNEETSKTNTLPNLKKKVKNKVLFE